MLAGKNQRFFPLPITYPSILPDLKGVADEIIGIDSVRGCAEMGRAFLG